MTCLAIALILGVVPRGRYVVASLASRARQTARRGLGLPMPREEVDAGWERFRGKGSPIRNVRWSMSTTEPSLTIND